jgi:hypothetical protein
MQGARRGIITTIASLVVAVSVGCGDAIARAPDGAICSGTTHFNQLRREVCNERKNLASAP